MIPDTTTVHTVIQTTTLINDVQGALNPMGWLMLFLGWLMYWLNKMNGCRIAAKGQPYFQGFWNDNVFEIPISALACLVIAILSANISTDLIDLRGILSVFLAGYGSSSILNSLITQGKGMAKPKE